MSASRSVTTGKIEPQKVFPSTISWWQWVLGVDVLLVLITIAHPHLAPYPGDSLNPFNLASEMNFAAWWSGILLLILGLLAYELYSIRRGSTRTAWLILAFVWAGLSWDEIGSLHERLATFFGWIAFVPVGLIGAGMVFYAFYLLLNERGTRGSAILILTGLFVMSSAVLFEYFERLVDWPAWVVGIRVGAEEGTELAGMFLCLVGVIKQRPQQMWPTGLSRVVPNPLRMAHVTYLVFGGLLFHLFVSSWTAMYVKIAERGDPAVWYPSALFLVLAFLALWRFWNRAQREIVDWSRFAVLTAITSVATLLIYDIQHKSHLVELLGVFSNLQGQMLVLLALFAFFALRLYGKLPRQKILVLSILFLIILSGFWIDGRFALYATSGLFALTMTMVFDLIAIRGWGETSP